MMGRGPRNRAGPGLFVGTHAREVHLPGAMPLAKLGGMY